MSSHSFSLKRLNSPLSLALVMFVLLAIPVTVYTVLRSEQDARDPDAATPINGFNEERIVGQLDKATAMEFAPDGRIFVLEQGRNGTANIRIVKNKTLLSQPFYTFTGVQHGGERGLLGIAFHPNFATNKYVYVFHTIAGVRHRVSRIVVNPTNPDVGSSIDMTYDMDIDNNENHNGGAIHFGTDGKLYIATGDDRVESNSQNINNRHGKILRLNPDFTIPTDNPKTFTTANGTNQTTTGANMAIYAMGFRNPFTFAVNPVNGKIYVNDVGHDSVKREEINDVQAGKNYGWPVCQGSCSDSRFTNPIYFYDPAAVGGCAITGGIFYQPTTVQYPVDYVGDYFFADFCASWGIRKLDPASPSNPTNFVTGTRSPVDLKVGPDGTLYYLARVGDTLQQGEIFRLVYGTIGDPDPDPGSTNIWCEAESPANIVTLTAPMVSGSASGVSYIYTSVTNTGTTLPTNTGRAEYTFNVPVAATYTFWGRVNYIDADQNSFWLQFDDQAPLNEFGNGSVFNSWHWENFLDGDGNQVVIRVPLSAGQHTLKVFGREANAKLDRWLLTTDSDFRPQDSSSGSAANCARATNAQPTATILTPLTDTTYAHGQTISFSGNGTDPEDGTLAANRFFWTIQFGHDAHLHPHSDVTGSKTGSFSANFSESADNVYYRVNLTVIDSANNQHTSFVDVRPRKSTNTITSVPPGLKVKLGTISDGVSASQEFTSPASFVGVEGFPRVLEVASPQSLSGKSYQFSAWSNGGSRIQTINTPAANTTYTATFQEVANKTGDINGDGSVGSADLAILISTWGSTSDLRADLNNDLRISSADLALMISRWGS